MFFLKKFVSQFLMPMPLVCMFFLVGWVLQRLTRFKKTGTTLKACSFCLFLLFGYGVGYGYLYKLERIYPPFDPTPEQCEQLRGTGVVVLGQGMPEESDLPLRYQNSGVFERRLFEGVRIAKLIPDSMLIVSMAGDGTIDNKRAYLNWYMEQVDFPTNRVEMVVDARDTNEEAHLSQFLIQSFDQTHKTNMLVLVSSASHLPRAVHVFREQGMNATPSPCDYVTPGKSCRTFQFPYIPFPSTSNFEFSQRAVYEYLGCLYERMR